MTSEDKMLNDEDYAAKVHHAQYGEFAAGGPIIMIQSDMKDFCCGCKHGGNCKTPCYEYIRQKIVEQK